MAPTSRQEKAIVKFFFLWNSGLQGKLYYFKSADDPPNYKGLIDMRECKAEDVDVDGLPRNAAKSKYDLDGGGGQVSLLIRISHKVRTRL